MVTRRQSVLAKFAFGGVTPVALLGGVLLILALFAIPKLTEGVTGVPATLSPTEVAAESGSPTPAESAGPTPTASAPIAVPVRTPTRTAAPDCDTRTYRISGRVTLAPEGDGMYNVAVEVYRASDGAYLNTFRTDTSGGYSAAVSGSAGYKLFFIPAVAARSEWWNDKTSKGAANVVSVCRSDVIGINAVLTR